MAVDPYRQCPCGSGKKMKFCCSKDILSDLDQVLRASKGISTWRRWIKLASWWTPRGRPVLLHLKANLELARE